jgi:hypothetical protein
MARNTGNDLADRKSDAVLRSLFDIKNDLKKSKDVLDIYQKKVMEWECQDMKKLGISDHYMILDSYQKLEDSHPERGEYKFHFNPRGATKDQAIGIRDDITRIIEITIGKFTIPLTKLVSFDKDVLNAADSSLSILDLTANSAAPTVDISTISDRTQQYAHRRITMYMRDISAQSFIDNEDSRHHFEFETSPHGHTSGTGHAHGNSILLTPIDDNYVFTDPINHIHGMIINFFNPDYALKMPPDVIYNVTMYSAKPNASISTSADNIVQIRFSDPTGQLDLLYGDRIFFKGFESYYNLVSGSTTTRTTQNHVLNRYINRPEGHIIGEDIVSTTSSIVSGVVIPVGNVYNIYLNPNIKTSLLDNFTTSGSAGSAYENGEEILSKTRVSMYIAKNRIRIPIRFRTLTKKYTNGIVAI